MDKKELVNEDIEAGRELVNELERAGLPIAAAMWLRTTDENTWQLYIASPDVETHGPISVYKFIDEVSERMPVRRIAIDDVVAANTTNHFVNAVAGVPAVQDSVVRVSSSFFNETSVEDAVIYKTKSGVRASPAPPKVETGGKGRRARAASDTSAE